MPHYIVLYEDGNHVICRLYEGVYSKYLACRTEDDARHTIEALVAYG